MRRAQRLRRSSLQRLRRLHLRRDSARPRVERAPLLRASTAPPWNSLSGAGGILRDGANRVAFQTGLQERAPFLSYGASALGSAVSAAPRNVAGGLMSGARSAIG